MKKKFAFLILTAMLSTALLTGCGGGKTEVEENTEATTIIDTASSNGEEETLSEETTLDAETQAKLDKILQPVKSLPQLEGVKPGDTVATIHTNKGDIKVWFFPEYAPKAVENFTTHAKEGYYDGTTFHRVIEEFMIQGGDPKGDGTGGESIWGEPFEVEPSYALRHFRGALCMAKSQAAVSIGSQFYIVQNNKLDENTISQLEELKTQGDQIMYKDDKKELKVGETVWPEKVIDEYIENGGVPTLDMQYTVFGQVYEGMDVVDAIAKVDKSMSASGELSVPNEEVKVISIEVGTYQE